MTGDGPRVIEATIRLFLIDGADDVTQMNVGLKANAAAIRTLRNLDPEAFDRLATAARRRRIREGYPPDPPTGDQPAKKARKPRLPMKGEG